MRSTPSRPGSRPNTRMPTNCPTRSISVSARSKRRCWRSKTDPVVYDPADIARAGVFVSIDSEGRLSVDRGYVRPEDEAPAVDPEIGQGADTSSTGARRPVLPCSARRSRSPVSPTEAEEDDEDVDKAFAGSAHHRADGTSHAGVAGCAGRKSSDHVPGGAAQLRADGLLPVRIVWKLS